MSGLDLSKFKKVKSDDQSTILKHKDGHEIRIAHKALSPKLKGQLDGLPKMMADGGDTSDDSDNQQPAQMPAININLGGMGQAPANGVPAALAPNGTPGTNNVANYSDVLPKNNYVNLPQDSALAKAGDAISNFQDKNQATDSIQPAGQKPQGLAPQPQAPISPQAAPAAPPGNEDDGDDDYTSQSGAAKLPASGPQSPQDFSSHKQAALQSLTSEDQAFQNDLTNGHITPKTYTDLMGTNTLGKIGSLFGLLLSGAGSGLSKQPNALLEMMNNEIKNDMTAQIQSKTNAQNLYKLNLEHQMQDAQITQMGHQGKLTDAQTQNVMAEAKLKAYTMAQMQANRIVLHDLVQKANALPPGSPEAAAAQQQLAMLSNGVQNENFGLADRASAASAFGKQLFGMQQGQGDEQSFQQKANGMRMLGPQGESRAKDMEEKHLPGVQGQASIPLSGGDRDSINSGIEFDQKLHRFMDWTQNHSGDLNPKDIKEGKAMAAELQGSYRQATHGGVYKEGEQNFISSIIDSDPTKFFNQVRVMPQLKAVASENQNRVNQLVKSKGFSGYQSPGSGGSSGGAQTRQMNGKTYVKVPGGWQAQ